MGRHAAADGAGTDPIVAAALARQDVGSTGTRRATADSSDDSSDGSDGGGLGWPGDTTTGGGLGWPGSLDTADDGTHDDGTHDDGTADDGTADDGTADDGTADDDAGDTADRTARIDAVPAVPGPRLSDDGPPAPRGWRRLFGGHAA